MYMYIHVHIQVPVLWWWQWVEYTGTVYIEYAHSQLKVCSDNNGATMVSSVLSGGPLTTSLETYFNVKYMCSGTYCIVDHSP